MTSIVVVSHSHKIAEGVKQLINQMTDGGVDLIAVGGLSDDEIGTSFDQIAVSYTHLTLPTSDLV